MCGIAGVIQPGRVPDAALVQRMAATLTHRGPDDSGVHVGEDVGLGFRRLAIVDLDTGNQPQQSQDGAVTVVFNGEIYNFRELRDRLEAKGHVFRTKGDAEVLPHLYQDMGIDMVDELRGMFAFALWDAPRRELFLARDRAGEKPLYYSESLPGGGLAFGSEIKALLAAGVSREPDRQALLEYLYHLYVPPPRSAFASIAKLPAGHLLRYRDGRATVSRYWSPAFRPARRTDEDHVSGLRERVLDAVKSRLVADVPIGAFLSGGIDSTSVVAGMKHAHEGPVHTFTITFEGFEHYDESEQARATAKHFGTEHHELRAQLDGPAVLPSLVDHFDEPFGNPTSVLINSLSEATREHVKVVLTGDGADELFFGYPRYKGLDWGQRYRRFAPGALRAGLAGASKFIPESTSGRHSLRRAREFLASGSLTQKAAYEEWIGYFTPGLLEESLVPDPDLQPRSATRFLETLFGPESDPDLNDVSRVELQSFLPCNVLEYADRMSMAHGLELRAPFVDHQLVEYVGTLPAEVKLRGGQSKWCLRRAMEPDLPPPVLGRPKLGLNPPLGSWLQGGARPLVRELLDPAVVRQRGLLQPEAVKRMLDAQERGRRDFSLHIWALLVLELWFRQRVDTPAAAG
jgi:asparagine synthase (glutamine-hydrolysing)